MAWMVEAPTPLARASPANCCFHASNPPAELPHCAALACEDRDMRSARAEQDRAMAWRKNCMGETVFGEGVGISGLLLAYTAPRFERCGEMTWPVSCLKI